MNPKMKWERNGVEYLALTEFARCKETMRVGWTIYRDGGGWTVGLLLSDVGELIGKHIAITHGSTLREAKFMAQAAANQLYHDEATP